MVIPPPLRIRGAGGTTAGGGNRRRGDLGMERGGRRAGSAGVGTAAVDTDTFPFVP